MFGKRPEERIYTESDLTRIDLDWLNHGIKPPEALGRLNGSVIFDVRSRSDLEAHNTRVSEILASKPNSELNRPRGRLNRALSVVNIIFTAGSSR